MSVPPTPCIFTENENLAMVCLVHIRLQDPGSSYELKGNPKNWGIVQTRIMPDGYVRRRWVIVDYREFTMTGTRAMWWHTW